LAESPRHSTYEDEIVDRLKKICFKDVRQTDKHLKLKRATGHTFVIPVLSRKSKVFRFKFDIEPGIIPETIDVMRYIIRRLQILFEWREEETTIFLLTGETPKNISCPIEQWTGGYLRKESY
jgi:predicted RNA binding protein YcfA (HicA-like mRNA interferase family)